MWFNKIVIYSLTLMLVMMTDSCQNENPDQKETEYYTEFDITSKNIVFESDGGKDTVTIPFDDYYLHYVRNNDSVLFFYLDEPDYDNMERIINRRSIVFRPEIIDPENGFSYLEWEWFALELNDNNVFITVMEKDTHNERIAEISIPCKKKTSAAIKGLNIKITQK